MGVRENAILCGSLHVVWLTLIQMRLETHAPTPQRVVYVIIQGAGAGRGCHKISSIDRTITVDNKEWMPHEEIRSHGTTITQPYQPGIDT